jgi:hypothetical protein
MTIEKWGGFHVELRFKLRAERKMLLSLLDQFVRGLLTERLIHISQLMAERL